MSEEKKTAKGMMIAILICIIFVICICYILFVLENKGIFSNGNNVSIFSINQTKVPIKEFCRSIGMIAGNTTLFERVYCVDGNGEIHYFNHSYDYKNNLWSIGDKKYNATFTRS